MNYLLLNVVESVEVSSPEASTTQKDDSDNNVVSKSVNDGYAFWILTSVVMLFLLIRSAVSKLRALKKYGPKSIRYISDEEVYVSEDDK